MFGAVCKSVLFIAILTTSLIGCAATAAFAALATDLIAMEEVTVSLQWGLDNLAYYAGMFGILTGANTLRVARPYVFGAIRQWFIELINNAVAKQLK